MTPDCSSLYSSPRFFPARFLPSTDARPSPTVCSGTAAITLCGAIAGIVLWGTSAFAAASSVTTATAAAIVTSTTTAAMSFTAAIATSTTAPGAADSLAWVPGWVLALSASPMVNSLLVALWETIYMVGLSSLYSLVIGFFIAIFMVMTGPHGLHPMPKLYRIFDFTVNIFRSLPFIILIIAIMPLTRLVMGTTIGTEATILPLTIAAAPFAARLIEGSFLEVDKGVVEAARSFGANDWQIIMRVMLPEALPAIVLNVAVLAITLLSYSAMAGTVGGGGLGDLAFRYGYQRFQTEFTVWAVVLLIILVQIIQSLGNVCYARLRSTKRAQQAVAAE